MLFDNLFISDNIFSFKQLLHSVLLFLISDFLLQVSSDDVQVLPLSNTAVAEWVGKFYCSSMSVCNTL